MINIQDLSTDQFFNHIRLIENIEYLMDYLSLST